MMLGLTEVLHSSNPKTTKPQLKLGMMASKHSNPQIPNTKKVVANYIVKKLKLYINTPQKNLNLSATGLQQKTATKKL